MRLSHAASLLALLAAGCGGGGGHSSPSPTGTALTFAANSIVYGVANGTNADYRVDEIAPTGGTPTTVVADVAGTIFAFALDPSQAGRYALAADPTGAGTYGIYLSKGLSLTNATRLVAPGYVSVGSIAVTPDGTHVVYTAASASGASELFVVPTTGGTPVDFGSADAAALSPSDGDTIATLGQDSSSGSEALSLRSLAAGPSGAGRPIAAGTTNPALPAFSRDGKKLAFWSLGTGGNALTIMTLAGGSTVSVPGVAAIEPQGEAFGEDGTTLAIVGQSGTNGIIATAPADGSAAPTTILTNSALLGNYGFFWTDANGRAVAGGRSTGSTSRSRKKSRP